MVKRFDIYAKNKNEFCLCAFTSQKDYIWLLDYVTHLLKKNHPEINFTIAVESHGVSLLRYNKNVITNEEFLNRKNLFGVVKNFKPDSIYHQIFYFLKDYKIVGDIENKKESRYVYTTCYGSLPYKKISEFEISKSQLLRNGKVVKRISNFSEITEPGECVGPPGEITVFCAMNGFRTHFITSNEDKIAAQALFPDCIITSC